MHNVTLLEVQDLKTYFTVRGTILRKHRKFVRAVDEVSILVAPKETVAVVGESGCGKTTLARTILQLTHPTEGSIKFLEQDAVKSREYY
jgi:oligopeptide transport system ATP-binding protein